VIGEDLNIHNTYFLVMNTRVSSDSPLKPYIGPTRVPKLFTALTAAETIYAPELHVHNAPHGIWVAEQTARLLEAANTPQEQRVATLAGAGVHDWGTGPIWRQIQETMPGASTQEQRTAYRKAYNAHAVVGAGLVWQRFPSYGFSREEAELAANIVNEHDRRQPSSLESACVIDADTLNKAGVHGIKQCLLVALEFGMNLEMLSERLNTSFPRYATEFNRGYHTDAAVAIDAELGEEGVRGLEYSALVWTTIHDSLAKGATQREMLRFLLDMKGFEEWKRDNAIIASLTTPTVKQ
jgi:hypothetical protein